MNDEPPQKKKPALSLVLFSFGAVCLLGGGWELATGRTLPFGRLHHRNRPVTEDKSYTMLIAGGALLAAGSFTRAWESR